MTLVRCLCFFILVPLASAAPPAEVFTQSIRPVLQQNCGPCHNPAVNPKSHVDFMKSETATIGRAASAAEPEVSARSR